MKTPSRSLLPLILTFCLCIHCDGQETLSATRAINVVEKQGLKLASDKVTYEHGDVMTVTVEVPLDGHLILYGVSANGQTVILFPNRFVKENQVKKGRLILPGADAKYEYVLSLDEGQKTCTETLHAVFSQAPFTETALQMPADAKSIFQALGVTTQEERATRGLKPVAVKASTNAELSYQIAR